MGLVLVSTKDNVSYVERDEREKRRKTAQLQEYIAIAKKEIRTHFLYAYLAIVVLTAAAVSMWWYGFIPIFPRAITFGTLREWTLTPEYKGPATYITIGAAGSVLVNQAYRILVRAHHVLKMKKDLSTLN